MDKHQTAKVKMYKTVVALCTENPTIVGRIAAFKMAAAKLKVQVTAIDSAAAIEADPTTVVTINKNKLRKLVCQLGADVAAALFAWAASEGDDEVLEQTGYSLYELGKLKEQRLVLVATKIYELGEAHKSDIDSFGVDGQTVDNLQDAIGDYSTAMPLPRNAVARRKAAKEKIATLIHDTDELLKNRMDKTVLLLKKTEADFYSQYCTSRKIVNPAVTHTKVKVMIVNKTTGAALYKAFMEIEALELVVYSNLEGELDSGKLKHGIYNIRLGAPGFMTVVVENVDVKLGKTVRLDIRLEPEAGEMNRVA